MDRHVREGGERGLKPRAEDEQDVHEAEVRELRDKIGQLVGWRLSRSGGRPDRGRGPRERAARSAIAG